MAERGTGICRGLSLWCKLIYRLRTLMAAEVAQIRSYEPGYGRNDSTLVSKLPEPIDIKNDIFKPDKTNKFSIAMTSALRTRNQIVVFQVDGKLNPADALTKWLASTARARHYLFLTGYPAKALKQWLDSREYKMFKPVKISPAPSEPKVSVEAIYRDVMASRSES